jgi:hypothetical protein
VAQWQRYHELPSTGFWGPASRSTVKKLGLHKLTTKATSAVDDPMGVNAARPRPLVPWSTVPVSTTVTSKQLVSGWQLSREVVLVVGASTRCDRLLASS